MAGEDTEKLIERVHNRLGPPGRGTSPDEALIRDLERALSARRQEIERLRKALTEVASDEFGGAPGQSIYAAAANELPRRVALAKAALANL